MSDLSHCLIIISVYRIEFLSCIVDGSVMPSWFDIQEIPVGAVSSIQPFKDNIFPFPGCFAFVTYFETIKSVFCLLSQHKWCDCCSSFFKFYLCDHIHFALSECSIALCGYLIQSAPIGHRKKFLHDFSSLEFFLNGWRVSCKLMMMLRCSVDCQESPNDEVGVMKAVRNIHAMIDKEISAGTNPENIFICGFSQGGT